MSELRWLPALRDRMERLCAEYSIPLGVCIGWIEVESGGKIGTTTALGEYGYYQISRDEAAELGIGYTQLALDVDFSLRAGCLLINRYRAIVAGYCADLSIDLVQGSEYHFRLTKLCHAWGMGALKIGLRIAVGECSAENWTDLAACLKSHEDSLFKQTGHSPSKWINFTDRCFGIGAPFGVELLACLPPSPSAV